MGWVVGLSGRVHGYEPVGFELQRSDQKVCEVASRRENEENLSMVSVDRAQAMEATFAPMLEIASKPERTLQVRLDVPLPIQNFTYLPVVVESPTFTPKLQSKCLRR